MTAGSPGQGPGDGHPLLLAAGELIGQVVELVAQAHLLQYLSGPLPALRLGDAGIHQRYLHIFQQVQLGQQVVLLKDEPQQLVADRCQLIGIHLPYVPSVQQISAGGGDVQTADDVHAGGFSGAGLANDSHKFPLFDAHGDVVRRPNCGVPHLIGLADLTKFDQRAHPGTPPPGPPPLGIPAGISPPMAPGIPPIIMLPDSVERVTYATVSPSCKPLRIWT